MPFIQNIKQGAAFFQTDSGNKTLRLLPGVNKISDEDYKTFKEKIDAAPHLCVVEETNDGPIPAPPLESNFFSDAEAEVEAEATEEEPEEEAEEESDDTAPHERQAPSTKKRRRK